MGDEQIETLAERILHAAGSSLRHYTMPSTRAAILEAVREAVSGNWREIASAPDGQLVLAIWLFRGVGEPHGSESHQVVRHDPGYGWHSDGVYVPEPTHWMPLTLPANPTAGEG